MYNYVIIFLLLFKLALYIACIKCCSLQCKKTIKLTSVVIMGGDKGTA